MVFADQLAAGKLTNQGNGNRIELRGFRRTLRSAISPGVASVDARTTAMFIEFFTLGNNPSDIPLEK
jgi:hypothetical protein